MRDIIDEIKETLDLVDPGVAKYYLIKTKVLLTEEVTYYNMRQFVTLLHRVTDDKALKDALLSLLKSLAILEIRDKPAPTIQKLKKVSPAIFGK